MLPEGDPNRTCVWNQDMFGVDAATDAGSAGDQKIALLNDLASAGTGTKPSADSIKALVKDLMSALVGKKITIEKQTTLARDLHAKKVGKIRYILLAILMHGVKQPVLLDGIGWRGLGTDNRRRRQSHRRGT